MPSPIVKELEQRLEQIDTRIQTAAKPRGTADAPARDQVLGSPWARKGEDPLSSRGFSFQRLAGVMAKVLQPEHAKLELEVHDRLTKAFVIGGQYATEAGAVMAPFATDFFPDASVDESFRREMKSLVLAGTAGADPDEIAWLRRKYYAPGQKAGPQSWLDESLGGSLVGPPEFGELIQLLRNKDALINAGARVIPLPPSGRVKFPRQTSATTGYYVGENQPVTPSNFGTGSLTLSAKKVACLVTMPSELIRFANPASEAILRSDMTKTLSLTMDKKLLEGLGSDVVPMGLLNTPNVATVTPTTVAANGNTLSPQDVYKFISAIEANNGEMEAWVMRPEMFWALHQARVSSLASNDQLGQFAFSQFRDAASGFTKTLAGYPVITTPQVANNRTKGAGNNLTYVTAGMWSDFLIAMFGSIEFAQATQGDTIFPSDQVAVRAILSHDGGARHSGAFAVADQLVAAVGA